MDPHQKDGKNFWQRDYPMVALILAFIGTMATLCACLPGAFNESGPPHIPTDTKSISVVVDHAENLPIGIVTAHIPSVIIDANTFGIVMHRNAKGGRYWYVNECHPEIGSSSLACQIPQIGSAANTPGGWDLYGLLVDGQTFDAIRDSGFMIRNSFTKDHEEGVLGFSAKIPLERA